MGILRTLGDLILNSLKVKGQKDSQAVLA
jgi:hypothetical protein